MKPMTRILLLCALTLAGLTACGTMERSESSEETLNLTRELNRLHTLYREAVRVPITPQIVSQAKEEKKYHLLGEIRYYTSVNVALLHDRVGESSLDLETQRLPRVVRNPRPAQGGQTSQSSPQASRAQASQGAQDSQNGQDSQDFWSSQSIQGPQTGPAQSLLMQEMAVLTFREGSSSLNQRRITRDDEGRLSIVSPEGDVFEITYPERGVTLGFVLNREKNWYDLAFAVDEATKERTALAMTGARPHLMIDYQAVFPTGETRIQMGAPSGAQAGLQPPPLPPPPQVPFSRDDPPVPVPPPEVPFNSPQPPAPASPSDPASPPAVPPGASSSVAETVPIPPPPPALPPAGTPPIANAVPSTEPDWSPQGGEFYYLEEAPPTAWNGRGEPYPGEAEPYLSGGEDPVEVAVLLPQAPAEKTASGGQGNRYIIQVGAFREKRNAAAAFAALEREGFSPIYEDYQNLTRVIIPAVEMGDLARTREIIKTLGFGEPYVRQ